MMSSTPWWVPALGMKKDAIPGFINELWTRIDEPGVYRGQCAELCGKDHGYMPIVVRAVTSEDYAAWVGEHHAAQAEAAQAALRDWTADELMARGEEIYITACAACHQQNGQGLLPAFPAITGSPIATGPLDAHLDRVMNGKPGHRHGRVRGAAQRLRSRRGHHVPAQRARQRRRGYRPARRHPGGPLRGRGSPSRERTAGGMGK